MREEIGGLFVLNLTRLLEAVERGLKPQASAGAPEEKSENKS